MDEMNFRKVVCGLCKNILVVKRIDIGDRYKYELVCPYCGWYKAWFEEKPNEPAPEPPVVKQKRGRK